MVDNATDARQWEYTTFAPKGEQCPECRRPIESLESVRRGTLQRPPGPPVVVYRHSACTTESE
ncbi:hypothetical protein AB0953_06540 [Streptomyces sp. NPDC046866]|uniref:hypothetical protein n=1 Tax=Streptomyces sp. NPDC046866 TaxID=3154921 RepID=UPI0034569E43